MSGDKAAASPPTAPAPSAASIKTTAAELYGLSLDDQAAARIAAELGRFQAAAASLGAIPTDTAPGALFRQLLLASDPGARRA
jgi:hypothetical protein